MLSAVEIYSRERAWGWRTRNCNQGLLRRYKQDLQGVSGKWDFPGCCFGSCEVFLPGYPRYVLRISEVLRLGFPSCLEDFLELGFPLAGQEPRFKKCS